MKKIFFTTKKQERKNHAPANLLKKQKLASGIKVAHT